MDLISIIEGLYVFYMFNYFKTSLSFHHPFEKMLTSDISTYLKHPIHSGNYENKICKFGHIVGGLICFLFIFRGIYNPEYDIIQASIYFLMLFGTILLNINSFIYMIPIFIYEFPLFKKFLINYL
jgi:hypothetical protein